jgi:hypothetical protein
MSVIHLEPKELSEIRNLFFNIRPTSENETLDRHFQALLDCNAKTYSQRYQVQTDIYRVSEFKKYFKIGLTKKQQIDAIDSFRSLIYNCSLDEEDFQIAYRYLSGILLIWMNSRLALAWGVEK